MGYNLNLCTQNPAPFRLFLHRGDILIHGGGNGDTLCAAWRGNHIEACTHTRGASSFCNAMTPEIARIARCAHADEAVGGVQMGSLRVESCR
jgi:hypothetical protein